MDDLVVVEEDFLVVVGKEMVKMAVYYSVHEEMAEVEEVEVVMEAEETEMLKVV